MNYDTLSVLCIVACSFIVYSVFCLSLAVTSLRNKDLYIYIIDFINDVDFYSCILASLLISVL